MEPFSADSLESAFRELSKELRFSGTKARLYVIGGAAIALAWNDDRVTMDVDAVIDSGHSAILKATQRIARRHGWTEDWLNDMATAAIPRGPDSISRTVYADSNLVVGAASAKHLLAMKLRAARQKDADDIAYLTRHLGICEAR